MKHKKAAVHTNEMLCNMSIILHIKKGSYLLDLFLFVTSVCNIDWEEFFFKRNLILFLQFFLLDKENTEKSVQSLMAE